VSTVLAALGIILVIAGLTLPLFLTVDSISEGVRQAGLPAILRIAVGASLLVGARWLRQGRRHGAAVLTAALLSINALVVRGWSGLVIALVAGLLAVPILTRWRILA
jgi:hypothetical protein